MDTLNNARRVEDVTIYDYSNSEDDGYVVGFIISFILALIVGAIVGVLNPREFAFWLYGLQQSFWLVIIFCLEMIAFYSLEKKEFISFLPGLVAGTIFGYIISYPTFFWLRNLCQSIF